MKTYSKNRKKILQTQQNILIIAFLREKMKFEPIFHTFPLFNPILTSTEIRLKISSVQTYNKLAG